MAVADEEASKKEVIFINISIVVVIVAISFILSSSCASIGEDAHNRDPFTVSVIQPVVIMMIKTREEQPDTG